MLLSFAPNFGYFPKGPLQTAPVEHSMQDYSISKCSRKCAVSGRGLAPGESYISVIMPDGESVRRLDIAASEWKGADKAAIGWWKCRMPELEAKKLRPAPNGVLLDTLSDLLERPGKEELAYLLAVLLMRRRVLAEEQLLDLEVADQPQTSLKLICQADGRQWNVPIVIGRTDALDELQAELNSLLFTEE